MGNEFLGGEWCCMSDTRVAAGVLYELVTVGKLAVSMANCKVSDVTSLLQVDREVATVLQFDQCLVGGGWVVLSFFHFGITSLNTGFNLLKLTKLHDNVHN